MSEGFAGIVSWKLKPGKLERFKALAIACSDAMSKEKEFVRAWIHTQADDPTIVVVYEAWSCSYEYFMQEVRDKPYRKPFEAEIEDITIGERTVQLLDYVASYPG